jgi:hypothetical protein
LCSIRTATASYLLQVAAQRLGPALWAKANPLDLVHETLLAAYRDFAELGGQSEAERLAWLHGQVFAPSLHLRSLEGIENVSARGSLAV